MTSEKSKVNQNTDSEIIKVVYSGGTGPWQSFEKVVDLLDDLMKRQSNVEAVFLTKENEVLGSFLKKYPARSSRKWVKHEEVAAIINQCDYGILLRENNITNKVASPVKFAEYLNAGLKVLISPNIGDFSEFAAQNDCGIIVDDQIPLLTKLSPSEKENAYELCATHFHKDSKNIQEKYTELFHQLNQA